MFCAADPSATSVVYVKKIDPHIGILESKLKTQNRGQETNHAIIVIHLLHPCCLYVMLSSRSLRLIYISIPLRNNAKTETVITDDSTLHTMHGPQKVVAVAAEIDASDSGSPSPASAGIGCCHGPDESRPSSRARRQDEPRRAA